MIAWIVLACVTPAGEADASERVAQAYAIFAQTKMQEHTKNGAKVIGLILRGRTHERLSRSELIVLAQAYNWAGPRENQLIVADLALEHGPRDLKALGWKENALYNLAYGLPTSDPLRKKQLAFYDDCIKSGVGNKTLWLLGKASALCDGSIGRGVPLGSIIGPCKLAITDKKAYEDAF